MATGQKSGDELQNVEEDSKDEEHRPSHSGSRMLLRDEVLISMEKFTSQVKQTIQQVEGEIKLEIPDIQLDKDPQKASRDVALVSRLERSVDSWTKVISNILEDQFKKYPQGNGPLAEVEFWKDRNSALNTLFLQLQVDTVQSILAILKAAGSASYSTYEITRTDLNKYYVEAKDNVKFLGTLERHFKNITHGASFAVVIDIIPAMMNSLRMVWVISRHYNTDERMVPLMERIAFELCERVARVINIRTIFRYIKQHC